MELRAICKCRNSSGWRDRERGALTIGIVLFDMGEIILGWLHAVLILTRSKVLIRMAFHKTVEGFFLIVCFDYAA